MNKLTLQLLLLSLFATQALVASAKACDSSGIICSDVSQEVIVDNYTVEHAGFESHIEITYKAMVTTRVEGNGVLNSQSVDQIQVESVILDTQCGDYGCGKGLYEKYLASQGTYGTLFFTNLLATSTQRVADKVFRDFVKNSSKVSKDDLLSQIAEPLKGFERPVYVKFSNKEILTEIIRIESDSFGNTKYTDNLAYNDGRGLISEGAGKLVLTDGALARSKFFRDYVYTEHKVTSCVTKEPAALSQGLSENLDSVMECAFTHVQKPKI